jgi:alanine dehydrogenase
MEYGVPREIRDLEMRVGLTPAGVLALVEAGHTVHVEHGAGVGAGFSDDDYRGSGGQIVYSAAEVYGRADVVAKLARPAAREHHLFRRGQMISSFLHLAVASPDLFQALKEREITALAYEMIEEDEGERPVLIPASEVAGRLAPVIAGQFLRVGVQGQELPALGILLGGIPGVPPADVVIVGGGVLGSNAAQAFLGLGAEVTVLDNDVDKLRTLDTRFGGRVTTMFSNEFNLKRAAGFADVLVVAVLIPGRQAPTLITRPMVKTMRPGSVIIDFSIDEGGSVETSRPTTLRDPAFVRDGVVHHCVPNITSTVPRTTSYAVTNAALPYLLAVGSHGLLGASQRDSALSRGVVLYQ